MADEKSPEERIREIGADIFESMRGEAPSFFDSRRWKGRMMEWAMKDERFKVQLFRFIDALPSLKTDREILKLLREYFYGEGDLLPKSLERWLPSGGLLGAVAGRAIKRNIKTLARQFIAGSKPEKALKQIEALVKEGRSYTVDLLGEVVLSDREANLYTERYLELIDVLAEFEDIHAGGRKVAGELTGSHISLKVSSFYSRLDPVDWEGSIEGVKKGLRPLFEKAREKGTAITFDMEHYHLKDITIAIFKSILEEFPDFPSAGIAIQAYLKESGNDLEGLIEWARQSERTITVRLVKGAYWDYEKVINRQRGWPVPVFEQKAGTDANFEKMTRLLLDSTDNVRPAIASHNVRSIAHAMACAEERSISKERIEFQTLYGMAEPIKKAVAGRGYMVRDYVPVGEFLPGMAYLVRRLLENTSNESFLRLSFVERLNFDELMAKPEPPLLKEETEKPAGFRNLPLTDFSRGEKRERFRNSLKSVRDEIRKSGKLPCVIGGERIITGGEIVSRNPADPEEVIGSISPASRDDAEKALGAAKAAFYKWRKTPATERAEYLFGAARWIEEKRFEIAALQVLEVGKSWKEADADVVEAVDFLNYYGREMIRLGSPERLGDYPGELNLHIYEPKGVGIVISPWNFPLAIPCGMTAATIVTGNCAILKPSTLSPVTAYRLVEAFEAAGLPPGVLQFLPGSGSEIGQYLAAHKDVDIIAFTGSMEVGLRITELAGKTAPGQRNVKKVIAEMGGKNAVIVDSSADLDEAVKGVLDSFLGYQGQKCSACSRAVVFEEIYEDFVERLTDAVKSITIGPPEDPENLMGPLVDRAAVEKVKGYIRTGNEEATLKYCGDAPDRGYFAAPAIFTDVSPDCRIANEEIFGPVLSVIRAGNLDEAIEIANATSYALTGGIYSRSPENIGRCREEFMVGNLYINRKITGALVGRQPFGGFGMSGLGSKAGGGDYLLHFMNPRCISENTLRRGFAPEA